MINFQTNSTSMLIETKYISLQILLYSSVSNIHVFGSIMSTTSKSLIESALDQH